MKTVITLILSLAFMVMPIYAKNDISIDHRPDKSEKEPDELLWIPVVIIVGAVIVVTQNGCKGCRKSPPPPPKIRCGVGPLYNNVDGCGKLIPAGANECPRCFTPVPKDVISPVMFISDGTENIINNELADGTFSFTNYTSAIKYSTNGVDWQIFEIDNMRTSDSFDSVFFYAGGIELVVLPPDKTFEQWQLEQGTNISDVYDIPVYETKPDVMFFQYVEIDN